jgi:hypothetical protein
MMKVDGTGSVSYPMAGFDICDTDISGSMMYNTYISSSIL